MSNITRRNFLQSTAAAAAAAITARSAFAADTTPSPSPATQSAASKLNVAAIGCLGKGESNIRLVADAGANIVALCDIDATSLGKAAKHYGNAKTYSDWRKMLDTQKDIDAVIVSTPDHSHAICAITAIKLGKHVYCEKPLTHNIAEVRKLMAAAHEAKVATQMGNQGHSTEASHEQVEWLRGGAIGKIKEVHVWTDRPVWPQGVNRPKDTPKLPDSINWDVWLGPAPERPYHPAYHPFKWRGYWDFGTGALGDMACHLMDTAYWALDLKNPASVEAFSDGMTEESPPKWSIIKYEFPQLGERPALKMFWYDGGLRPGMKLPTDVTLPTHDGGVLFVGEGGLLLAPYIKPPIHVDPERAQSYCPPAPSIPRPIQHHAQWVKAATGGPPATSNFDYSGPLTELVLLGNAAIRAQKRLDYDAASGQFTNASDANQYLTREYRKGWEVIPSPLQGEGPGEGRGFRISENGSLPNQSHRESESFDPHPNPLPARERELGFWLVIALLMSCMAQKAARFSTLDPDAFWHLCVAEQLSRDGIGPLVDDMSYLSIRTPWTPYSWLAELGMHAVWNLAGLRGAIIAQALAGALVIALVALTCLQMTGLPPQTDRYMPAVVATPLAGIWMLPFLAFRPVTLAIAILAACAWLLLRDRRFSERSRAVWLVVPLTALLVNVHIFAILVPLWVGALLVGSITETLSRYSGRGQGEGSFAPTNPSPSFEKPSPQSSPGVPGEEARRVRYAILLVLTLAALAATPMLRGMPATIRHLALRDPMVASGQVQELGRIWSDAYGVFITISAGISLLWIIYKRQLLRAGEMLWLVGMTILLVRYGRFAPVFALIAAPLLARTLPGPSDRLLKRRIVAAACAFALALGVWQTIIALPRSEQDPCVWLNRLGSDSITFPCAAADFVERHVAPRSGRLINEMNFGGYLAWRLGPQWQVMIDGRTQVYPPEVWRAYLGTPGDVKQLLSSSGADAAILPIRKSRFRAGLADLGWRRAYRDDFAEVLTPPWTP